MNTTPFISIIVVNWNTVDYIQKCLDSIYAQKYNNFEVIVVDNASSDDSVELIKKNFSKVQLIQNNDNLGFAEGNNIGIKHSRGEIIALINPDAVIEKEWLSTIVKVLQSSDKIGAAVGKIFYLEEQCDKNAVFCTWSKIDACSAMPYNFNGNEPFSNVDYLSGAAMIVKKDVIEKIGLLDADYFLYFDETDWCARMIRAGYDLTYTPYALVWHKVSASISDSDKKIYYMERSRIRFALKNFDLLYVPIFLVSFLLESIFIFFRDIKKRSFLRSKIRRQVIFWNLANIGKTIQSRKRDFSHLKKNGFVKSYNKSLPLRKFKTRNYSSRIC